jgi:hypothetical protein
MDNRKVHKDRGTMLIRKAQGHIFKCQFVSSEKVGVTIHKQLDFLKLKRWIKRMGKGRYNISEWSKVKQS